MLVRFPKSRGVTLGFSLYYFKDPQLHNLARADCYIRIPNVSSNTRTYPFFPQIHLRTLWRWPIEEGHSGDYVELLLVSKEAFAPLTTENQQQLEGKLKSTVLSYSQRRNVDIGQAHPTLSVHEQIGTTKQPHQAKFGQANALGLAKRFFHLTDKQYMDERLSSIKVGFNERRQDHAEPISQCHVLLDRGQYERSRNSMLGKFIHPDRHRAYIALGSNVGDRLSMIELACREMNNRGIRVQKTSALYETRAMYLEDQQSFINGGCEVRPFGIWII